MPDGPVQCREASLRQSGEIRLRADRPWLRLKAEQRFTAKGIDFRWRGRVRIATVLLLSVEDGFQAGHGLLGIRLFGIVPLSRFRGPQLDRGEALRGIAEMPWRPWGFAEQPGIAWTAAAGGKLRASYDDGATRCSAEFDVDAEGRVLACRAPDRPRTVRNESVDTPWSGTFADYAFFGGVRVPTRAEVAWHLPEGEFTYFRAEITGYRVD
jgi:Family of unknown function (DUF6544)